MTSASSPEKREKTGSSREESEAAASALLGHVFLCGICEPTFKGLPPTTPVRMAPMKDWKLCHRGRRLLAAIPLGATAGCSAIQDKLTNDSPRCCARAGEYNGYGSGPLSFICSVSCPCHD